jgi:preprotein translocase subunit SecA
MHIERAYAERESLTDRDLERLRAALVDQVERYRDTIRNYSPDRMAEHGKPFLDRLQDKVTTVDQLISQRAKVG